MNDHFARLKDRIKGDLHLDNLHKIIYATDASVYREIPLAVVIPYDEEDIVEVVKFCDQHKLSMIPRAGGTSLAGQCVGNGIVVDISKHFTDIVEINKEEKWVIVQPGVIRDELNRALKAYGLFFGPNTSTANRAMIGGMVGNNSCGTTSIVYGNTRDHLLDVKMVLADGMSTHFSAIEEGMLSEKLSQEGLEGDIYRYFHTMRNNEPLKQKIYENFPNPKIHRRNTGYAIDAIIDESSMDLTKLIAGSEGTLGFVTEIKLSLDDLPAPHEALMCIHFASVLESMKATEQVMHHKPFACELMDKKVLDCTKDHAQFEKDRYFLEGDPQAVLMVSYRADDVVDAIASCEALKSMLISSNLGYAYPIITEGINDIWNLRKAGLGLLANIPGDKAAVACIEDTAVALDDLADYISDFEKLMNNYGQEAVYYAHAGAGELHLRPILNLKDKEDRDLFYKISRDSAKLVKEYNGSLSGEHGDGRVRAPFIELMVGEQIYDVFREIKQLWDPNGIFNPGKIVDAKDIRSDLRYESNQPDFEYDTIFDFSKHQGLLRSAEKCNGSGDCRKLPTAGGTMCPSYQATRDEKDTTRARANTIREILTKKYNQNPFQDESLTEVLDLCMSCKGCTSECPSNVNMTMLKSELLYQKYKQTGIPWRSKVFGNINRINNLIRPLAGVSNAVLANSLLGGMMKRSLGIHEKRSLPPIHKKSLRSEISNHKSLPDRSTGKKVILFVDEFSEMYDVAIGLKAYELLRGLGYDVTIVDHAESGRAAFSKGLLDEAKQYADVNVETFSALTNEDIPLVGIEPSAILSFRDEYPLIVSDHLKARATTLKKHTFLIEEFLYSEACKGSIRQDQFHQEKKTIHLHGHCHQKALSNIEEAAFILSLPSQYEVRIIPSGCCGMAGSFGYEEEHYEISMKVGETTLFPYIRSIGDNELIAASGTSCRHQIFDGTSRKSYHPVEILHDALIKTV